MRISFVLAFLAAICLANLVPSVAQADFIYDLNVSGV